MKALTAIILKELLLLRRDRTGLLVLFLMPAVLVVVISLVQNNVLKTTGESGIQLLLIDRDDKALSHTIASQLHRAGGIEIVRTVKGKPIDDRTARALLSDGQYQVCLEIPPGFTDAVISRAGDQVKAAFDLGGAGAKAGQKPLDVTLSFDPMVQGAFRSGMENALQRVLLAMELRIKAQVITRLLKAKMAAETGAASPFDLSAPPAMDRPFSGISDAWGHERLMDVRSRMAVPGHVVKLPTAVQQNVPAWALFGMFFIVVPLGGAIIRERQDGTYGRLLTLPVFPATLLIGKVLAYVMVCLSQFFLIVLVGKFILPLLGTSVLQIGNAPLAVLAVVVCAALAACAYAILVGTVGTSYEQVSMFGSVSVVIAAALGGIMVPVYVMPRVMQEISRYSPLAWGLNALTDLFARGGKISTVLPEIGYLLGFATAAMIAAWMASVLSRR
jgi:ABC-2 type transport system permease protein